MAHAESDEELVAVYPTDTMDGDLSSPSPDTTRPDLDAGIDPKNTLSRRGFLDVCLATWLRVLLDNPLIIISTAPSLVAGLSGNTGAAKVLLLLLAVCIVTLLSLVPIQPNEEAGVLYPVIARLAKLFAISYCLRGIFDFMALWLLGPALMGLVSQIRDHRRQNLPPALSTYLGIVSFLVTVLLIIMTTYETYISLVLVTTLSPSTTKKFVVWDVTEQQKNYIWTALFTLVDVLSTCTAGLFAGTIMLYLSFCVTPLLQDLRQLEAIFIESVWTWDAAQVLKMKDEIVRCFRKERALLQLSQKISEVYSSVLGAWLLLDVLSVGACMARWFVGGYQGTIAVAGVWTGPVRCTVHFAFVFFMAVQPHPMLRRKLQADVSDVFLVGVR
ncbi:uncharacterized protein LOC129582346 [Paramacrobiotus metropolitanus]|uniref:uncharacterized protein LOC129582346 n=1 Tax=Paramacrobiotus metropolitanus TaxID=2943436 RepID=UPI002446367E|nr:uncharacterized protein LOC129582346 [Paramacrobiotus metropolitanus]